VIIKPDLLKWQTDFIDRFIARDARRNLLLADVGTGKTLTSLVLAKEMLRLKVVDSLLLLTDRLLIRDQWRHVAAQFQWISRHPLIARELRMALQ
jgi:superfamily II DNA or RNA helicase